MYFKDLMKYRNVWLGIAMLWIVLFHTNFVFETEWLKMVKNIGYGGVDICLFASGIGCYYSLSKDPDAAQFLKRRAKRILPTYWVFIVCWLIYRYEIGKFEFFMAVGNLFAVQNFTGRGNDFNWYISAILLFYILAPYLKKLVDKLSFIMNILVVALLIAFSLPFWKTATLIITVTRLPIFYIGILVGKLCKQDKKVKPVYWCFLPVMFVAGMVMLRIFLKYRVTELWYHGLYWYPFILITPPLCLAISYISYYMDKINVCSWFVKMISVIGKYSFEVYLVHILLIDIILALLPKVPEEKVKLVWLIGAVCLFFACYLLRQLTVLLSNVFSKIKSKIEPFLLDK